MLSTDVPRYITDSSANWTVQCIRVSIQILMYLIQDLANDTTEPKLSCVPFKRAIRTSEDGVVQRICSRIHSVSQLVPCTVHYVMLVRRSLVRMRSRIRIRSCIRMRYTRSHIRMMSPRPHYNPRFHSKNEISFLLIPRSQSSHSTSSNAPMFFFFTDARSP